MQRDIKFVRLEDRKSEASCSIEIEDSINDGNHKRKVRQSVNAVLKSIGGKLEKMNNWRRDSAVLPVSDEQSTRKKILDPQGPFLQKWNKILAITCVMAVAFDPLFFYIPVINEDKKCLDLDGKLQITACLLRTFLDLVYILRIIFQFKTGFITYFSRVFGRDELIDDPGAIMKRYFKSHLIIDVLSFIPLPQVIVVAINPIQYTFFFWLKYALSIQYILRVWRSYQLFEEVTITYRSLTEKAWARAYFNLFFFIQASHMVGALWYMLSIESEVGCWRRELKPASLFHEHLSCGDRDQHVFPFLNKTCSFVDPDKITDTKTFNFGIFFDALNSGVVKSTTDFRKKFFYCLWWGLRNLSSLGQNLKTSTDVMETVFAIFVSIFGLVLFSLLIGNMQKYLQYMCWVFRTLKLICGSGNKIKKGERETI